MAEYLTDHAEPCIDLPPIRVIEKEIEKAPLYGLDNAAADRSRQLMGDAFDALCLYAPTVPADGATVADGFSATYLRVASIPADKVGILNKLGTRTGAGQKLAYFASGYQTEYPGRGHVTVCTTGTIVLEDGDGKLDTVLLNTRIYVRADAGTAVTTIHITPQGKVVGYKLDLAAGSTSPDLTPMSADDIKSVKSSVSRNLVASLAHLDYVDRPCHYVVEERPSHVPEDRKPGAKKSPRFDDRERWILLTPEAVKTRFAASADAGGTHAPPAPHLRRAHERTFRSERYTYMRGKTIRVRPIWVGSREWKTKRLNYRVVSRPGSAENQA